MGEIAEAMISGEMCEACGEYIGEDVGYPLYCSIDCAKDRGADISQVVQGMSEEDYRQERKEKKLSNERWSIDHLKEKGYEVQILSEKNGHYRIGEWDFWPRTGMFYNRVDKRKDRGVKNLIKLLTQQ